MTPLLNEMQNEVYLQEMARKAEYQRSAAAVKSSTLLLARLVKVVLATLFNVR
jgi:hypothetical protein